MSAATHTHTHREFRLLSKDIGFSAYFSVSGGSGSGGGEAAEDSEEVEVVAYSKIYAEHGAVRGAYAPVGAFGGQGTLRFVWDNSFSKLTAKKVAFKLQYAN